MFTKGYVLVLHGLNSTPGDMRSLTGALKFAGFAVHAPDLPGAGGGIRLKGLKAEDFIEAAFREWDRVDGSGCKAIVGLSLGGMLGALIASHYDDVSALVMLSPTTSPPGGFAGRLLPYLHWLKPWYSPFKEEDLSNPELLHRLEARYPGLDLKSEAGRARVLEESKIPTAALAAVVKLQKKMLQALPETKAPVLAMFGGADELVSRSDEERLCKALSQRKVVREVKWMSNCSFGGRNVPSAWTVWFERSPHCLPCGLDQEQVANTVVEFLEVVCEQ